MDEQRDAIQEGQKETPGFPFATVGATILAIFLFAGLVLIAYYSPNYLGDVRTEPNNDPVGKLKEIQERNRAVLDGNDPNAKMSAVKAAAEIMTYTEKSKGAKDEYGQLPFPKAPPAFEAPAVKK